MNIIKETESHFLIKGPVHPKNIRVLNICVPSNRVSKYMKKKKGIELLGEMDKSPRIVEDFKTLFQPSVKRVDEESVRI